MKSLFSVVTKILVLAALVLAASYVALAQAPRHLQPNEHTTNLPGATTIEAPPAGFDPIAAKAAIDAHGFYAFAVLVEERDGLQDIGI